MMVIAKAGRCKEVSGEINIFSHFDNILTVSNLDVNIEMQCRR
jgi:hypothetical protein